MSMFSSKFLNVFQPSMGEDEAKAVHDVMRTNWIGRGKICLDFEQKFGEHLGVNADRLLSIASCTDGLFLAMELAGVGEGDLVIMPTISFIGAANAVAAHGARPIFCDVDRRTLNITADAFEKSLHGLPYVRRNRYKAVILLHYGGYPCSAEDIEGISQLCGELDIKIVEDSACSISSKVGDVQCGTMFSYGMWSFDAMKILSTGDGGMLYVANPKDRYRAEKRAFLGLTQTSGLSADPNSEWWGVDVDLPGRRCLMNDLTAAIGRVQLEKLPGFIARRKAIHERYIEELSGIDDLLPPPPLPEYCRSSYYLFWVQLPDSRTRNDLAHYLRARDIYTTFRYFPLHQVRYYADRYPQPDLPNAEHVAAVTLCLPIHQALTDDDIDRVCDSVRMFMASRGIP